MCESGDPLGAERAGGFEVFDGRKREGGGGLFDPGGPGGRDDKGVLIADDGE